MITELPSHSTYPMGNIPTVYYQKVEKISYHKFLKLIIKAIEGVKGKSQIHSVPEMTIQCLGILKCFF